jgi:hypothetical protein
MHIQKRQHFFIAHQHVFGLIEAVTLICGFDVFDDFACGFECANQPV